MDERPKHTPSYLHQRTHSQQLIIASEGMPVRRREGRIKFDAITFCGARITTAQKEFFDRLILATRCAMAEQGWELTEEPLYMAVLLYRPPEKRKRIEWAKKSKWEKEQCLCTSAEPVLSNTLFKLKAIFKDIVYKDPRQISGIFTAKFYSDVPRIEVVFGKPENVEEMLYDLRNI